MRSCNDTQCWGQEHNPPFTRFACGKQEKSAGAQLLGLGTVKNPQPPLRREGGAKFEREGKPNDPQLLADQRGSSRVNT